MYCKSLLFSKKSETRRRERNELDVIIPLFFFSKCYNSFMEFLDYLDEEELTKEFYDSLIDIKEYKHIQYNFLKEINIPK